MDDLVGRLDGCLVELLHSLGLVVEASTGYGPAQEQKLSRMYWVGKEEVRMA